MRLLPVRALASHAGSTEMTDVSHDYVTAKNGDITVTWDGLKNGDIGQWIELPVGACSVEVLGEFGVSGKCRIEGSNSRNKGVAVQDRFGAAMDIASEGIDSLVTAPRFIRPSVTGDENTSLTVTIFARAK